MVPSWLSAARVRVLAALAAAAVTVAFTLHLPLLYFQDSIHYLSLAEHVARGDGWHSNMYLWPDVMQPPAFVLLVALAIRLGIPSVVAGVGVCAVAAGLIVWPLWRLHTAAWGARGAWLVALLAVVYPNQGSYSQTTLEPLFCLLLVWSAAVAVAAFERGSAWRAFGCGLLLGALLLTRPEAVVTIALLGTAALMWPRLERRPAIIAAMAAGLLAVAAPYGAWMHAKTGRVDLMPKVTYNERFADIYDHMIWPPEQASLTARDQRIVYTLMPDDVTFKFLYAFDHPDYDLRADYPRGGAATRRHVLAATVWNIVVDGARASGLFHPLMLLVLGAAVWAGRRRPVVLLLTALGAAHLVPCLLSGDDFQTRFTAPTLAVWLPLGSGGAVALADTISRRWRRRAEPTLAVVAALLLAVQSWLALNVLRHALHEPARLTAIEEACDRVVPLGAHVVADTSRCAYLRGGSAAQLPYVESVAQLERYLAGHGAEVLILDTRTLAKNPSATLRALGDPAAWPAHWRALTTADETGRPIHFISVKRPL